MLRAIQVTDEDDRPLAGRAQLQFETWEFDDDAIEVEVSDNGEIAYDDEAIQTSRLAVMVPDRPGLWSACARSFDLVEALVCPAIETEGPSWWHRLLGGSIEDGERGAGIRIGVIDMGFEPDDGLGQVEILSAPDAERPAPRQRWSHGEAVCRILGDLSAPESCAPIAPGADLVFANASYTKLTREDQDFAFPIAEADAGDYLDPRLVASFIYELAYSSEVDLINLSLGSFDIEEGQGRGVTEAIWAAVDAGVTVICSAGNRFVDHAAFPAEHPECIGVGAFGADDWGPENTMTRWYAEECPSDGVGELGGQTVFFWSESAHGEGVDVIGPGVGILMARGGEPCFELSGTSFAAPIVTGLMAVELGRDVSYLGMPRDSDRVAYVRRRLSGLAQKTGMEERYEGEGAVTLDAADF